MRPRPEGCGSNGSSEPHFHAAPGWAENGGDVGMAMTMAGQASDTLNAVLDLVGGAVVNPDQLTRQPYGYESIWFYGGPAGVYNDARRGIDEGVIRTLKTARIEGGDPIVLRALERTDALTVEQLSGELQIAKDYSTYLANREEINALIAAEPHSAFAVGWALTLT